MAATEIHTYHCICNELVAAYRGRLEESSKRSRDQAAVCSIASSTVSPSGGIALSSSTQIDEEAFVLKLEDGFEKQYAVRCGRCDLQIGYMLDRASFDEASSGRKSDVVYLLPGGLMSTEQVREGKAKDMAKEIELVAETAG